MSAAAHTTVVDLRRRPAPAVPGRPSVSVVIPLIANNEALVGLLERLTGSPHPPDEIILVDAAFSAASRSLARRYHCLYLRTRAGRGQQMHAGALRAAGEILWFLDADCEPPPEGVALIRALHLRGSQGGYFDFRFLGTSTWYKALLAKSVNLRSRLGIPCGHQGLFASRAVYDAIGGFADTPILEEVPLVRGLRRHGACERIAADIGVSPRRWELDGWLCRTLRSRMLAGAHLLGVPPHRLARRFRPQVAFDAEPPAGNSAAV